MSAEIADVVGAYSKAWAGHDVDAIVALHAPDSVFHVHGLSNAASGITSVRLLVDAFLANVPDLHFERKRVYLGAGHVVLEYDMSGTAAGSHFTCDGVDIIAISSGLVTRKDTYLDLVGLKEQTGALPLMMGEAPTSIAESIRLG